MPRKKTVKGADLPALSTQLSAAHLKLLEVLRDPAVLGLDITKITKLAGISRQTYYEAFKNDTFKKAIEDEVPKLLSASELPVVNNVLQKASDPGQKSHHWAKMALEMMGRLNAEAKKPTQIAIIFEGINRPAFESVKVIKPDTNAD